MVYQGHYLGVEISVGVDLRFWFQGSFVVFQLDLKRVQVAMAAGRLDDAYDVLTRSHQRSHRDGQKLTDRLASAFVKRGSQHLGEDRLAAARSDAGKAFQLAGHRDDVAALVSQVAQQQDLEQRSEQRNHAVLQDARRQAAVGALTLGKQLIASHETHDAKSLRDSIEQDQVIAADAAEKISGAIRSGDDERAVQLVQGLTLALRQHRLVAEQIGPLAKSLSAAARKDFDSGRLDRFLSRVGQLEQLGLGNQDATELATTLKTCRKAQTQLAGGNVSASLEQLQLLRQTNPGAVWLEELCEKLGEVCRLLDASRSGPLGLLAAASMETETGFALRINAPAEARSQRITPGLDQKIRNEVATGAPGSDAIRGPNIGAIDEVDRRGTQGAELGPCLLRIDGLGGILILPQDEISIGSVSQSGRYDLPLLSHRRRAPISISRRSGDYFAESVEPFVVSGQEFPTRLLSSGDVIEFDAKSGRIGFFKPVAASCSAILQLRSAKLRTRDIRSVALMADSLVFGPTGSHFPLAGSEGTIVLFERGGRLMIKHAASGVSKQVLRYGEPVLVGEHRFSLSPANVS